MTVKRNITSLHSFAYIRRQLNLSSKALAGFIGQQEMENGYVYTFVPEDTSEDQLNNFESGGLYYSEKKFINGVLLSPTINESRPKIEELIKKHLDATADNCCFFEEPHATPSDRWVINEKVKYVESNDEMYYFFDRKNIIDEELKRAFLNSDGYYFFFVLSSLNVEAHDKLKAFSKISAVTLKAVADNATTFFVKAYDGEGYLIWSKS